MKITDLPPEIISQIASHLDSLSAIASLSLTCRKLNVELSQVDCQAYRAFLERYFPELKPEKPYKDTARALASRSRAWDRRAFIARVLDPKIPYRPPPIRHKIGYQPAIDSYECWFGGRWTDRREILVWGAGPRLILRKRRASRFDDREDGAPVSPSTEWSYYDSPGTGYAQEDILDIKLLRPEQRKTVFGEDIILRRANDEIALLGYDYSEREFTQKHRYITNEGIECLDINNASEPLMAVAYKETNTSLFPVYPDSETKEPLAKIAKDDRPAATTRNRCLKFISDEKIAITKQSPDSGSYSPINIYQLRPDGSSSKLVFQRENALFPDTNDSTAPRRGNANTIAPILAPSILGGDPGSLFLSGWTDGVVHLHDLRSPTPHPVLSFSDAVDDGQILSLLPLSHTHFLAGSSQSGCLKTFDLRLSTKAQQRYSYLSATKFLPGRRPTDRTPMETKRLDPLTRRQINTLLAIDLSVTDRLYYRPSPSSASSRSNGPFTATSTLRPRHPASSRTYGQTYGAGSRASATSRYRGAVYSLSTPSPLSRAVYAGIENHVIQIDAVSTDDVLSPTKLDYDWAVFGGSPSEDREEGNGWDHDEEEVVNLACYERPSNASTGGTGTGTGSSAGPVVVREAMPLWKQSSVGKMRGGMGGGGGPHHRHHHHSTAQMQTHAYAGWDARWFVDSGGGGGEGGPGRGTEGAWRRGERR